MTTILRARVVMPVARPLIDNGAVLVVGNSIASVGRWHDLRKAHAAACVDLGDALLLPGLINAHCHLDYTDMAGAFVPTKCFTDWIKAITTEKATWGYSEFAHSWLKGAGMLLRHGVTTVADIEAVPGLLGEVWAATPLRVHSFLEMTGVRSRRQPEAILREATQVMDSLPAGHGRTGLSPHAPYSTTPALLRLSAEAARQRGCGLVTHVAESATEFEMFMAGRGEMFSWLKRSERNMSDCGQCSPVQHLARNGMLSERLMAVHANYLHGDDAALLGRSSVSVVHCPRSHDYFGHAPFPFRELSAAGVNVCLGTDSLATVRKRRKQPVELNLFDETRLFAANWPGVRSETILEMVTVNGARALGMTGQIGEITPGAHADLIALPWAAGVRQMGEAVVHHDGEVMASMLDGHWVIPPPHL